MDIFAKDKKYIADTYARKPICIASGKGAICTDIDGKEYIDLGSGIGVNALGYSDDQWSEAVAKQAATLQHTSNLYYTLPAANLAETLCEATGYKKVFLSNSGAEANECAIKIARKYSSDKYGVAACRNTIITLVNSFHGRTVTTLSATGQDSFHKYYHPFTPGFRYVQVGDIDGLKALLDSTVCAIMIEPIQGEGGVIALEREYLHIVERICKSNDIMLIADEVQTGIGRTGKTLCCEHSGIQPDLVTLAKGLGGGLPIGATLINEALSTVLKPSDHGSTYGGNPVACAGANVIMERVLNDKFLSSVTDKGNYLRAELEGIDEVESVSGIGLMLGVKLKHKLAADVCNDCLAQGLIVLTAKDKLRLLPPLVITYDQLNRAISILKAVLSQ